MKKILLFMGLVMSGVAMGQAPKIEWSKCYGGSSNDWSTSITPTYDGGYIAVGGTSSNDGDVSGAYGQLDFWVVKMGKNGQVEWKKTLGGSSGDAAYSVVQCKDSNYIVAGYSGSSNGNLTNNKGQNDYWVVKLNRQGIVLWQKNFGGTSIDYGACIQQTSDGGFILLGTTYSIDGDVVGNHGNGGSSDCWILKLSAVGSIQWQKCLGGTADEWGQSIKQTTDGGYIVAGFSQSNNGDVNGHHGDSTTYDCWVVKLSSTGNVQWQKSLGGDGTDQAKCVLQANDGGYIVAGLSESVNGDVTGNHGNSDYWVVKLNSTGSIIWQRSLGGSGYDEAWYLEKTYDNCYVVTGHSGSSNGNVIGHNSTSGWGNGWNYWIVKMDNSGNIKWQQSYGGSASDDSWCVRQTNDRGLIIAGYTDSNDGDIAINNNYTSTFPNDNFWIVKLAPDYPTLQGYIFTDHNSDSTKDTLEPYKANVKVQLSNGNYTFTDNNGFYQIQADSIGAYTLTVIPPTGYNAFPSSITYNFNTYDTTVTRDIALQPNIIKDSVMINVIPMLMNAVQGEAMPYWIQYYNAGTTILSPTVSLTYNNYLLAYDSCTDANAVATANGIVTGELNMQPSKTNNLISYFTIKPSANVGDTLTTVYNISTATTSQTDSFYMVIEGGTAPANAQRATPSLTQAQVAAGKEIVYTIGFKNTGNDTAYNVVITDTLSNLLQANTLQMVASSHTCRTTVKGNLVTFELLNVNLPKAATNNLKSMGFVSFKVKPKTSLVAGNIITNKANTYYNYRAPQSSVATTIIKGTLPVKIKNYELRITNEKEITNYWTTSTEVNTSHFNIQRSEDVREFKTVGRVAAKGIGEYQFTDELKTKDQLPETLYYRLQAMDKDGQTGYSSIKQVTINNKSQTIAIYPNPAKTTVIIECENAKELLITDYLGKILMIKKIVSNQYSTVNVQQYSKGLYFVKLVLNNGEIKTQKLIIE